MKNVKEFYSVKKVFTIYALIAEDDGDTLAFVGKTTAQDLKAVLRRHLRGEVLLTKNDFSKGATSGEPRIVPLEHVECTGAVAYQHLLCWYRILDEEGGLMTTNPMATDAQAYNMSTSTEKIYRSIRATASVHNLLNGIESPVPVTLKKQSGLPVSERKVIQMNIRVQQDDKETFYDMCRKNHMSQREGFMHLLLLSPLLADTEKQSSSDRLLTEKTSTIVRQQQTIQELERKLSNKYRGMAADEKLKNALLNTKHLTKKYIDLVIPRSKGKPLRCLSFNEWNRTYGGFSSYPYPSTAGHTVVELESICYGKGNTPAIFLFGRDLVADDLIKLRYYNTRYAVGFSPKNEYAFPGSLFLVGYAPTTDGVMGITFLLPLPNGSVLTKPSAPSNERIPSLDEVIANIEAKHTY